MTAERRHEALVSTLMARLEADGTYTHRLPADDTDQAEELRRAGRKAARRLGFHVQTSATRLDEAGVPNTVEVHIAVRGGMTDEQAATWQRRTLDRAQRILDGTEPPFLSGP